MFTFFDCEANFSKHQDSCDSMVAVNSFLRFIKFIFITMNTHIIIFRCFIVLSENSGVGNLLPVNSDIGCKGALHTEGWSPLCPYDILWELKRRKGHKLLLIGKFNYTRTMENVLWSKKQKCFPMTSQVWDQSSKWGSFQSCSSSILL